MGYWKVNGMIHIEHVTNDRVVIN